MQMEMEAQRILKIFIYFKNICAACYIFMSGVWSKSELEGITSHCHLLGGIPVFNLQISAAIWVCANIQWLWQKVHASIWLPSFSRTVHILSDWEHAIFNPAWKII